MPGGSIILTNIGQLLTMKDNGLGIVENATLRVRDGHIAEITEGQENHRDTEKEGGTAKDAKSASTWRNRRGTEKQTGGHVVDCKGCVVLPGFVDPHTHLVFGGWRAGEFEQRLLGKTYKEIAQAGGGILSTVKATRQATEEELLARSRERLLEMVSWGTTTVEVKSGYGLDTETELKMLRVAKRLGEEGPATVVPTFLGAHSVPKESGQAVKRSSEERGLHQAVD